MRKISLLFFSLLSFMISSGYVHAASLKELKTIPILENGRVKPLDTFARESLQLIYGKTTFKKDSGSKMSALEVVMTWMLQPSAWEDAALFEISYGELKKALKLDVTKKYFSYQEILSANMLPTLMQDLTSRRDSKEKLDPFFQAVQRMESQIFTFREIANGNMFHVYPPTEGKSWKNLAQISDVAQQEAFKNVVQKFADYIIVLAKGATESEVLESQNQLDSSALDFKKMARAINPELYPSDTKMNAELFYQEFHPFQWAWSLYLLGALSAFIAWIFRKEKWMIPAWIFVVSGFLLHLMGFGLRVYISERAPVTNMYETVIWVGFGAVTFAMIIEAIYRWRFILLAGAILGTFCLALADMAPVILDGSLHPLEPVLRNNFWLLVHVLMITISYAAFFLAFMLGDIGLVYYLIDESKYQEKIKAISLVIYRALQIGVALLAPGIILGGVWADYSWGRFWGWDPKETWALIALLGYLAVLHGKVGGFIKDFGLMATSIVTFSLVIMAWYGVNFVLGAGLHSYGFGAGGVEYVSVFVAAHICYVAFAVFYRRAKSSERK